MPYSKKQSNKVYAPRRANQAVRYKRPPVQSKPARKRVYKKSEPSHGIAHDVGAWLGGKLGDLFSKITGFGDYTVESNSLLAAAGAPGTIVNTKVDDPNVIILRHREFITDIAPTTNFTVQSFRINPGVQASYPWLSDIATSFEQYELRGMIYEFKSTSADAVYSASANTSLGSVCMATNYNALASNFTSKQEMLNYQFSNSAKPSESFVHPIECKRDLSTLTRLYVRGGAQNSGVSVDPRLYDMGLFQIATQGMQSTTGVLGELWVTYEIALLKPRMSGGGRTDHYCLATISNSAPLGTTSGANTVALGIKNSIGGVLNGAGTTYSFPAGIASGKYMVVLDWSGSTAVCAKPSLTLANCTSPNAWLNNTVANSYTPGTIATFMWTFVLNISGPNATFTLGADGTLPTSTNGDLYVTEMDAYTN